MLLSAEDFRSKPHHLLIVPSRKETRVIPSKRKKSKVVIALDSWKANLLIFIRIIGLLRPHWIPTLGTVISMGLSTGFALIVPWLLAWVIDTGRQHGQFSSNPCFQFTEGSFRLWTGISFPGSFEPRSL